MKELHEEGRYEKLAAYLESEYEALYEEEVEKLKAEYPSFWDEETGEFTGPVTTNAIEGTRRPHDEYVESGNPLGVA